MLRNPLEKANPKIDKAGAGSIWERRNVMFSILEWLMCGILVFWLGVFGIGLFIRHCFGSS
jgi:hypothetical protein